MTLTSLLQARGKVFLAWCEGMLAERIDKTALSCGMSQLGPFAQVNVETCL